MLMPHLQGIDRQAKLNVSLEELIAEENPVRDLDLLALTGGKKIGRLNNLLP